MAGICPTICPTSAIKAAIGSSREHDAHAAVHCVLAASAHAADLDSVFLNTIAAAAGDDPAANAFKILGQNAETLLSLPVVGVKPQPARTADAHAPQIAARAPLSVTQQTGGGCAHSPSSAHTVLRVHTLRAECQYANRSTLTCLTIQWVTHVTSSSRPGATT